MVVMTFTPCLLILPLRNWHTYLEDFETPSLAPDIYVEFSDVKCLRVCGVAICL
jgi:hypothetical protein